MLLAIRKAWNGALQIPALYPELKMAKKYFISLHDLWTQTHPCFRCYSNEKIFKMKKLATIPCCKLTTDRNI